MQSHLTAPAITRERAKNLIDLYSRRAARHYGDADIMDQKRRQLSVRLWRDVNPTDFELLVGLIDDLNTALGSDWRDQWDSPAEHLRYIQATEERIREEIGGMTFQFKAAA